MARQSVRLTDKAKAILTKVQKDHGNDELLLLQYSKLCSLVGRDVADAALGETILAQIKSAHDRKYHPKTDRISEGGEKHDRKPYTRGRKPSYA